MERVEAAQLGRHVVAVLVRLGDHHHQRVRQRAAGQHEQLEHVVERGRVRTAGADDGEHLLEIRAEEIRGELRLAGAHPVDVSAQRVDLAVVGDEAIRVRKLPARERVRRVPRVDEGHGRLDARVAEVEIEAVELRRRQHSLVDERSGGQARDDEVGSRFALHEPPDHVELALERVLVAGELGGRCHHGLADARCDRCRGGAGYRRVDRYVTPGEEPLAFGLDDPLDQSLERGASRVVGRQEEGADAVGARRGQRAAELRAEERIRDLHENARAVAALGVCAGGAAVLEILERRQCTPNRFVGRHRVEARDERDAAGVVLVRRVVQAEVGCRSVRVHAEGPRVVGRQRVSASGASRRWRRGRPTSAYGCARRTRRRSTCLRSDCATSRSRASLPRGLASTLLPGFMRAPTPSGLGEPRKKPAGRQSHGLRRPAARRNGATSACGQSAPRPRRWQATGHGP